MELPPAESDSGVTLQAFGGFARSHTQERDHSRIAPGALARGQGHQPLFAGVASPGKLVSVTICDATGLNRSDLSVIADPNGIWLAHVTHFNYLSTEWRLLIEISTPSWSEATDVRRIGFLFSPLPFMEFRENEDRTALPDIIGSVFTSLPPSRIDDLLPISW